MARRSLTRSSPGTDAADGKAPADQPAAEDEASSTIQSVERAAKLLGFFTVGRPRLTLSEITARLGVSKATAHRYAMVLRRVNFFIY